MEKRENERKFNVKVEFAEEMTSNEMQHIYGSGNSQVRYISDEYIQAKILREHIGGIL